MVSMKINLSLCFDMVSAIDALRLGADDYLLKPCDPEEFIIRINTTATFFVIPECLCRESRVFGVMQRQRLWIPAKNMPE